MHLNFEVLVLRFVITTLLVPFFTWLSAQNASIFGKIKDKNNQIVTDAILEILETGQKTISDSAGNYNIPLNAGRYRLQIKHLNYQTVELDIKVQESEKKFLPILLTPKDIQIEGTDITAQNDRKQRPDQLQFERFPTKDIASMPTFKSDIESKIVMMPGVATNNEFSSQYRVRGGNFDENAVYVNEIEIYRPQLVRAGFQEGLGFTNSALVHDIAFSTGGFEPKYADKMSSILAIEYRKPKRFKGTAEAGLLTQNLHLEGSTKNKEDSLQAGNFTYLFGARRFSITNLLKTLDTQGEYKPLFWDAQALFTFSKPAKHRGMKIRSNDTLFVPDKPLEFQLFVHTAQNLYYFEPQTRETNLGTINIPLRLLVAFGGAEITSYFTQFGALKISFKPSYRLHITHIFSAFQTNETENIDVEGAYRLADVSNNLGSDRFNEIIAIRGIGSFIHFARNKLYANVLSAEHKGSWWTSPQNKHQISWGLRWKNEFILDHLKEWSAIDSADYVKIKEVIRSQNELLSQRWEGYVQGSFRLGSMVRSVLGARAHYWTLNQQFLLSPRFQLVIDPSLAIDTLQNPWQIRLALGMYNQPPFYRELRNLQGIVNPHVQAQKSFHFILGGDYLFEAFGRPFKLFAEAYYKILQDLVPYEIDNVRIRYYGQNAAKGYAYGLDTKLSGEFIRGIDSWLNISYLKTMEDLTIDQKGYIRRPTDQRFTVSFYFQDEFPLNPTFKVHINYIFGSGIPFGPPANIENKSVFQMPSYHRVDLGLSKLLILRDGKNRFSMKSLWGSLEIFNLFGRPNTVSYLWVQDYAGIQYAIPNYLSARMLNIRVIAKF